MQVNLIKIKLGEIELDRVRQVLFCMNKLHNSWNFQEYNNSMHTVTKVITENMASDIVFLDEQTKIPLFICR